MYTNLSIGDEVIVHCNKKHKQWKEFTAAELDNLFPPAIHTIQEIRSGPRNYHLARLTNGFEYVLETGKQYNAELTYLTTTNEQD